MAAGGLRSLAEADLLPAPAPVVLVSDPPFYPDALLDAVDGASMPLQEGCLSLKSLVI